MKALLAVLPATLLVAAAPTPQQVADSETVIRLYLAVDGVEGNTPLRGLSPAQENPVVGTCGGPARLYVWGQVLTTEPTVKYISLGYNVRTNASAEVVAAHTWNYTNILPRWAITNGGQIVGGELLNVRLAANPTSNLGVANHNYSGFDLQLDESTASTVLGWIEVDGVGEIRLEVGDIVFVPDTPVYLGFDDEGIPGNPIPEATVFECGDLNCDGRFNGADIDPFFLALGDPSAYELAFPNCDIVLGDMNGDGNVNGADIDPFFECLGSGVCP